MEARRAFQAVPRRGSSSSFFLGILFLCFSFALPAQAQVSVTVQAPLEFGFVVYQGIAPPQRGQPKQARLSMRMRVRNNEAAAVRVTDIYILGTKVSKFAQPVTIPAGGFYDFQNCDCEDSVPLILNPPFPQSAAVSVFLEGRMFAVQTTVSLLPHGNDGGPLQYPGKVSDLRPNEVWGASSAHPSGHQVFALDTGVLGWNSTAWSETFPGVDGSQKEHWRAYGMPVYAMADGTVCWALNDHQERLSTYSKELTISPSLGAYMGGGNQIFVKTGDEIFVVAHLQPGSIPSELMVPGAPVQKGQYLGRVGLSGDTSHPHTHIHVKREPASGAPNTALPPLEMNGCDYGWFRPMTFNNLQSLTEAEGNALGFAGTLDASDWTPLSDHSAPNEYGLLYPSADPVPFNKTLTNSRQYIGVWRAGQELELTVKAAGWTRFTQKWQELSGDRFRLVELNTFVENGERQYVGLFKRGTGGHFLWSIAGWDAFQAKWVEMDAAGQRLVDLDTYQEGSTRVFIGVFRSGSDTQKLVSVTGWDAFTLRRSSLAQEGLHLVDVETFLTSQGQRQYIGVFRQGSGESALLSTTGWFNFTSKWSEYAAQGLRLVDIETFAVGTSRQFIGVFRQGTGGYSLESVTGYDRFVQAMERNRNAGLRLTDIHVEQ